MTNASKLLQSLIIYSICLPLALFIGYQVAAPADWTSLGGIGLVLLILITPVLLRFHHPLLVFAWNSIMVVPLLPGPPKLWMLAVAVSFLISIVTRTLVQSYRFIWLPELARPMILLFILVLVTAEARGGIGLRSLGGQVQGGQRYFFVFGAILGYFALTAKQIPVRRAALYVALFFLGATTIVVGDLFPLSRGWTRYFFLLFPPTTVDAGMQLGVTRFTGIATACSACVSYMIARYGLRGIFLAQKPARLVLFLFFLISSLLGGYRSVLLCLMLILALQFYLEGLHKTRLLLTMILSLILAVPLMLAFVQYLPSTFQRTLAFVPGIPIDPVVRQEAELSSEWRLNMWRSVLPDIPRYLIVGKGYAMDPRDMALMRETGQRSTAESAEVATMAGDYHNGPLSVIVTFGLPGVALYFWLAFAGYRVLYRNYRYGDPQLREVNTLLLATFIARTIMFLFVVGSLQHDLLQFAGILGLGVSLNGRVREPVVIRRTVPATIRVPARPSAGFSR